MKILVYQTAHPLKLLVEGRFWHTRPLWRVIQRPPKIALRMATLHFQAQLARLSITHSTRFCGKERHAEAEIVSTFVSSILSASVLARLPHLRFIATRSTGYDHIDRAYCRSHGITVSNVPDYGDATVAEHVFALLLAVARNLIEAVERTRRGNFSQAGLRGFELRGMTLGVIGTGRIGRRVIEIAKGFGMAVVAFDVHPNEEAARRLGFRYADLDALLATADVVTLHVPATPQTAGLLSDRAFGLMRSGAVLINTARGNVVDVPALGHSQKENTQTTA